MTIGGATALRWESLTGKGNHRQVSDKVVVRLV